VLRSGAHGAFRMQHLPSESWHGDDLEAPHAKTNAAGDMIAR